MRRTHILVQRRGAVLVGFVLTVMVGSWLALDAPSALAQSVSAQQEESQNWSGYVVKSTAGESYSNVSGSWVEPTVNPSAASQRYAAFWVGLGGAGQSSQALEQVGTTAQVDGAGHASYSAWYELVPSAEVSLPLTIHAGDHMTGRVSVNGTNVTVYLSNQTTGKSVTKTLQMSNPDTSSAEWIAEAPAAELSDGSAQVLPLANFGNVTFTNASATAGGHTGSISDPAWTVAQVDMTSQPTAFNGGGGGFTSAATTQQSTSGATAGQLSDDGTSFTVAYSSQQGSSSAAGASSGYGYPGSGGYGYPGSDGYSGGYGDPGYGYGGYGYPGDGGYVYVYVQ